MRGLSGGGTSFGMRERTAAADSIGVAAAAVAATAAAV